MFSIVAPNHLSENPSENTKSLVSRARADRPVITLPIRGPLKVHNSSTLFKWNLPPNRRVESAILWTLEEFEANPALLIMYLNDSCPYVQHLRKEIVELANDYMEKGLGVLAISSENITTCPQNGPNYPFTRWYDEEQDLAEILSVVYTPEFFLFKQDNDEELFELVYHGQFDDSRPHNDVPVTGRDLRIAIDCVLNDLPVPSDQKPSVGCRIKGNLIAAEE